MRPPCACSHLAASPRFVAITGGPGAGKTVALEVVQRHFCEHVVVLPESASLLFRGGFPRRSSAGGRRALQRAVYRVQVELERIAADGGAAAVVLCDRGTVDSIAYWDGPPGSFWDEVSTTGPHELGRYAAVIHLRTPPGDAGYGYLNPLRVETPEQARDLDQRIFDAWSGHPARTVIESAPSFLDKLAAAIDAIRREVPACCQPAHSVRA
jgi:predicted ATPase